MTRVVVDRIETQQDKLQFGDPIGCHYHWLEPDKVDSYGDSVRRLATKVELAVDAFERTSTLSEDVFAGEAADTLRDRAGRRHEESATVRDNLRGLGRAINAYSDVLRRHREGLEQLHDFAVGTGLEVRGNRIWPPVETLPGDATQKQADAWEADWKAYRRASRPRSSCVTSAGSPPASWSGAGRARRRAPRQGPRHARRRRGQPGERSASCAARRPRRPSRPCRRGTPPRPPAHGRDTSGAGSRPRSTGSRRLVLAERPARGGRGPGRPRSRRCTASSPSPRSRCATPRPSPTASRPQANRAARDLENAEAGTPRTDLRDRLG